MLKRKTLDEQLELFPSAVFYLSQADAAKALGITPRMIQYWESQGLLNPELEVAGRGRKYTPRDMVEMRFIKSLVVDQGYSVPALKKKLKSLESPYYYDPDDVFWDEKSQSWLTRGELASLCLQAHRDRLLPFFVELMERMMPCEFEVLAGALLDFTRDVLSGKVTLPKRRIKRRRSRGKRQKRFGSNSLRKKQ